MTVHWQSFAEGAPKDDQARETRIRLIPFEDIKLSTHRRYLVKGIIPRVGLSCHSACNIDPLSRGIGVQN